MRIGRTLSPTAAPIYLKDIFFGLKGLIRGSKEINRFESKLKKYFHRNHSFLLSSGKASLTIILKACHEVYPDKKKIIIPALTCYSVPAAILKAGLEIQLCDVNLQTLDFDYDHLKIILSDSKNSFLAILPTHLFGFSVDIKRLRTQIVDHEMVIIEDAAQAMGGQIDTAMLGTLGDVGFFSLDRGKSISSVAGGIILTNDNKIAAAIKKHIEKLPQTQALDILKLFFYSIALSFFMRPFLFWLPKALPFLKLGETIFEPDFPVRKFSSFQAGLMIGWEKKLKRMQMVRSQNVKYWRTFFSEIKQSSSFFLFKPQTQPLIKQPLYVQSIDKRNKILRQSESLGLGIMNIYPKSIDNIEQIKELFDDQKCPMAAQLARGVITLPVHPLVSERDRVKLIKLLNKEFNNR